MNEMMDGFRSYLDNLTRYFEEKLSALQSVASDQANQIEALTNKIIMIGTLAIILLIVIIILAIALKINSSRKRRRDAKEVKLAAERLRREEERLRQQRMMYEEQMQRGPYDNRRPFDDYGYNEEKFGHGEYRDSWTPDKARKKANKKTAKAAKAAKVAKARRKKPAQKPVACSHRYIADMFVPKERDYTTDYYEDFNKADMTPEEREAIRNWDENNRW
ncbi:MAG: hypothetical protein PUB09_07605 [Firmicutes bacterium]|nr:hypothetical protein [Bacillota bacterium]